MKESGTFCRALRRRKIRARGLDVRLRLVFDPSGLRVSFRASLEPRGRARIHRPANERDVRHLLGRRLVREPFVPARVGDRRDRLVEKRRDISDEWPVLARSGPAILLRLQVVQCDRGVWNGPDSLGRRCGDGRFGRSRHSANNAVKSLELDRSIIP